MKELLGGNMKNSSNKQKQIMTGNSKLGGKEVVYDSLKLANGLPVTQYGTNYSQHTYRFTVQ